MRSPNSFLDLTVLAHFPQFQNDWNADPQNFYVFFFGTPPYYVATISKVQNMMTADERTLEVSATSLVTSETSAGA